MLPELVKAIRSVGCEVFEPSSDNPERERTLSEPGWAAVLDRPSWAYRSSQTDLDALKRCDAIFVCVHGTPDEGAMVELGVAIALGKPIFLYRDDVRNPPTVERYPMDAKCFAGMPEEGWADHYYTALHEIANPTKAFARWVGGGDPRPPPAVTEEKEDETKEE